MLTEHHHHFHCKITVIIVFIRCDVTKKDDLVALYDNCEKHFDAKVIFLDDPHDNDDCYDDDNRYDVN